MTINIITGGSRGLGRAMALQLADKGQDSIITYRSRRADAEAVLKEIEAKGRRAAAIEFDAGDTSRIPGFADAIRKTLHDVWRRDSFDHLVNNAGHGMDAPIAALTEPEFDDLMRVHLKAPFFLTQALHGALKAAAANRAAKVINIASIDGISVNPWETYSYAASKAGLIHLTKRMALRLAQDNIVVSGIAPGPFASDMNKEARDHGDAVAERVPVGRIGRDEDMAGAAIFLASRAGDYVVGETVVVDGGVSIARG